MIRINDTVISLELFEERFLCDLASCKGICCIEGDSGAPLEWEEIDILEAILPEIREDLSEVSLNLIDEQGVYYIDEDDEPVTSIVNGRECVFTYTDENGTCKCAIEKAYREGKIDFYKPVSCHLYPVRLQKYKEFTAVNIHKWSVCECARSLGKINNVPVYKFLKEPLIRKFGAEWYEQVKFAANELANYNFSGEANNIRQQ